ncbi:hypothetical protein [Afipia sp. GAS231]|uniref:hypothetical protein n=1 Tax=Afipia sp. GAS231 TaxID=1882747 RepID=UPI00087B36E8|nr:hypothetical protein [Afipia sp. GAS231]SDO49162.1 hypothetical protein SAMN05444050_4265 [Afipia sp. GAS231]
MNNAIEKEKTPLFIKGYLTDRFAAGKRPIYGFPTNHLPETTGEDMEATTGFLAPCDTTKN